MISKNQLQSSLEFIEDMLKIHAISGCDTVSSLHGISKPTALEISKTRRYPLTSLGSIDASISDVVVECTRFVSACYGHESDDMTKCRLSVWEKKTSGYTIVKAPDLKSLPPTTDSFFYHVLRVHIQAIIWLMLCNLVHHSLIRRNMDGRLMLQERSLFQL